ncbi:MAG: APC family permease [Candidatus Kryptoniota bacterium]
MTQTESGSSTGGLIRGLNTFDMTMIVIGSIIGAGIFMTPSSIAGELRSPALIILVWVIGGVMALCGALTYAELGAMIPEAGGVYVYLSKAYGGIWGFLYGWAYLVVVNTGGIAAIALVYASYIGYFVHLSPLGVKVVAISGIILLTGVNYFGVVIAGKFASIFTVLKVAAVVGLIAAGFMFGSHNGSSFDQVIPGHLGTNLSAEIAMALVGVLWAYGGWQHATFLAGEAKNPRKSLPTSIIFGTIVVITAYVLVNLVYLYILPVPVIASSNHVAADAAGRVLGKIGGIFISVAIIISTFGTAGIYTMSAPRIYYAMASDGVFFRKMAYIHPKYRTPGFAIILQSMWVIVLLMVGNFLQLITYAIFVDWIFFGLTAAAVFVFRRTMPDVERPYRTPGYPYTTLFFVLVAFWFVVNTLVTARIQSLAGLAFILLGIPIYFYWKRVNSRSIGAPSNG